MSTKGEAPQPRQPQPDRQPQWAKPHAPKLKGGPDRDQLDAVFAALGNETRRTILAILSVRRTHLTSGEIAGYFTCSWQTISRHLKVLDQAGLVSYVPQGRDRAYVIERAYLDAVAADWITRLIAGLGAPQ
jgi:DNA-binding transcriptional ArsR family regulator